MIKEIVFIVLCASLIVVSVLIYRCVRSIGK